MQKLRVLITGFGPFPGMPENPSAWLAENLAERWPPAGVDDDLHTRVLPTEWEAAALIPRLCETLQPHVMIHFGVCENAKALRIERSAHNRAAPRADAKGALPLGPAIRAAGPDRLDTPIPASALARHLNSAGVSAVTSHCAGQYLCNFLYYHALDWAAAQSRPRLALFVHVPPPAASFGEERLLHGAQEIARFVLAFAAEQEPATRLASPLVVGAKEESL
jgi:pyroglutamyl-peptidase